MNLEEAQRLAQRHQDTYNHDFERYLDLYTEDFEAYRPAQGVTHDRATMHALEQRATAGCPDRRTTVLRVLAGDGDSFGVEGLWEGTNTGGDAMFGPAGMRVAVYAFTIYEVRADKFVRAVAWTGRPNTQGG